MVAKAGMGVPLFKNRTLYLGSKGLDVRFPGLLAFQLKALSFDDGISGIGELGGKVQN